MGCTVKYKITGHTKSTAIIHLKELIVFGEREHDKVFS